jgi:hypothetical protein
MTRVRPDSGHCVCGFAGIDCEPGTFQYVLIFSQNPLQRQNHCSSLEMARLITASGKLPRFNNAEKH